MANVSRNGGGDPLAHKSGLAPMSRVYHTNKSGFAGDAFLPCIMSTSGRIHGEFLRLPCFIAHSRTVRSAAASERVTFGTRVPQLVELRPALLPSGVRCAVPPRRWPCFSYQSMCLGVAKASSSSVDSYFVTGV